MDNLAFPRNATEFGEFLRQKRKALCMTLADAADAAGISRQTLVAVESGRGNPRLDTLQALAEVLHLRVGIAPATA